jgi:hypothetical protein
MTAILPERPMAPTYQERIEKELDWFFRDADFHALFSDALWCALQSPEQTTTDLKVNGKLVTLTAAPGPMTRDGLAETRELLYGLDLRIGSRVFVDGPGLVRAEVAK